MESRRTNALRQIEHLIRDARVDEARAAVAELAKQPLTRVEKLPVIRYAWRVGLAELGVAWLHKLVREEKRATESEKAEYGICLIKTGGVEEGLEVLSSVSPAVVPAALLYRAFGQIARGKHTEALPFLQEYLDGSLTAYARLVAKLTLASCLIRVGRLKGARFILRETLHDASVRRWNLVLGRALELSAECFRGLGRPKEAEKMLAKLRAQFPDARKSEADAPRLASSPL